MKSPGKGSCFRVLLPAVAICEGIAACGPVGALQASGVILVVDDEPVVRNMAQKGLERNGFPPKNTTAPGSLRRAAGRV